MFDNIRCFNSVVQSTHVFVDKCMGVVAAFEGRIGMFIDGQIYPPLDNVEVTVIDPDKVLVAEVFSNDAGQFR